MSLKFSICMKKSVYLSSPLLLVSEAVSIFPHARAATDRPLFIHTWPSTTDTSKLLGSAATPRPQLLGVGSSPFSFATSYTMMCSVTTFPVPWHEARPSTFVRGEGHTRRVQTLCQGSNEQVFINSLALTLVLSEFNFICIHGTGSVPGTLCTLTHLSLLRAPMRQSTAIILTSQIRKLRHRTVKQHAHEVTQPLRSGRTGIWIQAESSRTFVFNYCTSLSAPPSSQ